MHQNFVGNKKGFSLIELLIAIAILSITVTSLLELASFSLRATLLVKQNSQANNIARELMEQVRNFRDGTLWSYDGLGVAASGVDYYLQKTGSPSQWQLVLGTETKNGFTRKVVFNNVMRDVNDNIVASGGVDDPDTRKITVTVSWQEKGNANQVEITSYLTNWQ